MTASDMLALMIALGDQSKIHAGGVRERVKERLALGTVTIYNWPVQRTRFMCEYAQEISGFTLALERGMVVLQALPEDSTLQGMVSRLLRRTDLIVRQAYAPRPRHRIRPSGSFEQYLESRSKSTRQTFRYLLKKAHAEHKVSLEVYESPDQVEDFVKKASAIASETYQQVRLGMGFSKLETITRRLKAMAARGWLKGFVLHLDDEPVAYIEGYGTDGVWVANQVGYLPRLAKLSVGTLCQLESIRYLIDNGIRVIDYMEGDSDYKRRLSTESTTETTWWIAKKKISSVLLFAAIDALDVINNRLRSLRGVSRDLIVRAVKPRDT